MASVSDELRAAREQAGLTLADLSARTKIKQSMLQAIETGDFDRLPGPFFARAFVRSYARELGLSADEIVKHYAEEVEPPPVEPPPLPPPVRTAPPWWTASLRTRPVLAAVAIVIVAMLLERAGRNHTATQSTPGAVGTSGDVEASAAPSVPPTAPPAPARPAPGEPIVLEIRPTAQTWVAATADGERVIYRELRAGEQTTVKARDEIALRIGNAAGFDYVINGAPGRSLGGEGEVRDARITQETLLSFRR